MTTNAITISLTEIRAKSPRTDGWRTVLAAKGGKDADMEAQFPLADIIETGSFDDALWALRCRPEYNKLWRKYAVWCARQVEHLLTDDRSVAALDVAWRHSDGLATDEELAATWAAAWATSTAAARDAAWSAAWATAWDATRAAQRQKLIEILNAGEWV